MRYFSRRRQNRSSLQPHRGPHLQTDSTGGGSHESQGATNKAENSREAASWERFFVYHGWSLLHKNIAHRDNGNGSMGLWKHLLPRNALELKLSVCPVLWMVTAKNEKQWNTTAMPSHLGYYFLIYYLLPFVLRDSRRQEYNILSTTLHFDNANSSCVDTNKRPLQKLVHCSRHLIRGGLKLGKLIDRKVSCHLVSRQSPPSVNKFL